VRTLQFLYSRWGIGPTLLEGGMPDDCPELKQGPSAKFSLPRAYPFLLTYTFHLLDGLLNVFASRADFTVVASSGSPAQAQVIAEAHLPEILILDPGDSEEGFNVVTAIAGMGREMKVVVFTTVNRIEHAVRALDAGASAYLTSASTSGELLEAVQTVLAGDSFISPGIATRLIASLRTAAFTKAAAQKLRLTVREEQIVGLLHKGKTNREIGQDLGLSEKTVKHYMTVLMQKLAARSRLEVVLALKALDPGLAPPLQRSVN
jgi:two-component system, NarL family, nitrate/nitrite response regulator NarL